MAWMLPLTTDLNPNLFLVVLIGTCHARFELKDRLYKSLTFKTLKNVWIILCDNLWVVIISKTLFTTKKSKARPHHNYWFALKIVDYFTLDGWSYFFSNENSWAFYFPYRKIFQQSTALLVCFSFSQTWANSKLQRKPLQKNTSSI